MSDILNLIREVLPLVNILKKPKDIVVDREDNIVYIAIEFQSVDEAKAVEAKINEWKRRLLQ